VNKYYDHDTVFGMVPGFRDYVTIVEADGTKENRSDDSDVSPSNVQARISRN
jgi:hypothetical protein